jgi:hypothetical protein
MLEDSGRQPELLRHHNGVPPGETTLRFDRQYAFVALLLVVALATTGCSSPRLTGKTVTREVSLRPVTEVDINGGALHIRRGSPTSLVVRSDRAVARYVVARQRDGVLFLGIPDDADIRSYVYPPMPKGAPPEFELTTDSLNRIELGDGVVVANGLKTDRLLLRANLGTATLNNIDVRDFRCEMVGGVANVVVSGVADTSSHTNSSGSNYDDSRLKLR